MSILVPVTKYFTVSALLPIEDERFAWWHAQGVWRALHDDQGNGPYADTYLIDNISRAIGNGWYHSLDDERLHTSEFFLGMIHGGNVHPKTRSRTISGPLVKLTDFDFTSGYYNGRLHLQEATEAAFMHLLLTYAQKALLALNLAYSLGAFVSNMDLRLFPIPALHV